MVTFSDKLIFKGIHRSGDKYVCVKFTDPRSKYGYDEYQCFFGQDNISKLMSLKEGDLFVVQRTEYSKKKSGDWVTVVLYHVIRVNNKE